MENILDSVENMQETPFKSLMQSKPTMLDCITPAKEDQEMDRESENSGNDLRKSSAPYRLQVPKAFKFPERYRSPTDLMISPITKGLLARNRKDGALLPPSLNQPKQVQDVEVQGEVAAFKIEI
ncbi:PREDICTED: uncharacterized protein LOC105114531 isoform X3 [Populus euphratica]|uniref:Uncharacterized protein LOC105114531 isoform X3 n=1 Tax=Populus euphratica TaxID=75702 RepID=A0AAJ6TDN0_POPEU|nr:PREDICTED: uncharacterized protein LOC105114531 isoform X3 [Populus euphratica]